MAKAADFNLFDAEERALAAAEQLRAGLDTAADPALRDGLAALTDAYSRSVREQRRLVRVSDRQHAQLNQLNQELARRRAEAEEALARLKEAQETLVQAQKLASLGALVAGVAHEINTPVGIALSCASHLSDATAGLRRMFEADDIAVDDFERYLATADDTARLIQANCERAAELIRSFKQVAVDRTTSERRRFNLADTINETLVSLGPRLRQAGHAIGVDCPPGLEIDGYPGALSQVLSNLILNSVVHGYDEGQSGRLTIAAEAGEGDTVRLTYGDDGSGIPEEFRGRVFDPFFTTRRGSGGTGLGLHIVYNLVTGPMGGHVALEPGPGPGARFVMTFPRNLSDASPAPDVSRPTGPAGAAPAAGP
ncbi:sensor histidine kinase [Magnetospirillum sp. UT-4]|uniref:sensor histidine kinase n=1 Tax=Magnetospirillum sp. UT-4 TaxID=2681467 RepID=UPI001381D1A0|nr:HAMP domain-containing sensor histidine kinase [Magnetospirillum sp. UT-4]CAA7611786.1 Signal transduction histidine kinase [Magnetospirillum sp. UT-4]